MSTDDVLVGKACPRKTCRGTLKCVNSEQTADGKFMRRRYACNVCGCRPADNKRLIPIQYAGARVATNSNDSAQNGQ